MRIDTYLFEKGFASSRTKAKELIDSGRIKVNGNVVTKSSFDVTDEAEIILEPSDKTKFVGRGGLKLEAALDAFGIDCKGKICADIGASTGGFTDCLLKRGAEKVFAIDSGTGQLVKELLENSRVISIEGMNARYMTRDDLNGEGVSLVVMDVSFISQKLIYPAIKNIALDGADIVTLIKPQFEAGRENIGKNGIVKNDKIRLKVIEDITENAKLFGFERLGLIESPIKGGSGNTEYLIHLKHTQKGDNNDN